ncbi:MAG TPA: CPBP family intramembrane glutamic endopeptidase [Solirubrobacteraceae bacterium]
MSTRGPLPAAGEPQVPARQQAEAPLEPPPEQPPLELTRSPDTDWIWWIGLVAPVVAIVVASLAALAVDLPALLFGVKVTGNHTPAGLVIADTFVQDAAFVVVAVYCAKVGRRTVRSWQFGLRAPPLGWRRALGLVALLLVSFLVLDLIWAELLHPTKEKLLETLGTKENASLLVLSAALTCVVAPIGEEMLFRGYMFTALRNWRGTLPAAVITGLWFGIVHVFSAPVLDLLPLAALGFGLCLLYRYTGSLYVSIVAHTLNNTIAFSALEGWSFLQGCALGACALAGVWLVVAAGKRAGLIAAGTGLARPAT